MPETGWQPGPFTPLTAYFAHNGTSDATFDVFLATSAAPTKPNGLRYRLVEQ